MSDSSDWFASVTWTRGGRGDPALAASDDLALARRAIQAAHDASGQRADFLSFLDAHVDAAHRTCVPGHLTGSALVVDTSGEHLALLHHRKLQRWLQPGGHADGDTNLAGVALREAEEETGIVGLEVLWPAVDLDVHAVSSKGEARHLHYDVRFVVVAPGDAVLNANHESTALRWVRFEDLADYDPDPGLRRLAAAAQAVLRR